ncbi:hypothetical protein ACIRQY_18055 [Streptomyces sp. NPDC101490]|uniref:hypothetical protein n=1 Tax=Streptomyces sp. NPDC101490 TaxID=3366143 RepID=UPI0037FC7764
MHTIVGLPRHAPAASWVNARIRELMDEPRSERRTAEYRRLLGLWAEAAEGAPAGRAPEFVTAA